MKNLLMVYFNLKSILLIPTPSTIPLSFQISPFFCYLTLKTFYKHLHPLTVNMTGSVVDVKCMFPAFNPKDSVADKYLKEQQQKCYVCRSTEFELKKIV